MTLVSTRILLVEDDAPLRRALSIKLHHTIPGVIVDIAGDGEDAIASCKKFCPDIIVTDILMPVMDGFEFLEVLAEQKLCPNAKILVLSNSILNSGDKEKVDSREGVDDYLPKSLTSLVDVISKIKSYAKKNIETNAKTQEEADVKKAFDITST